ALGYYYRGRAREMLGQRAAAITDFRAVLRIRPNHKSSRAALARLGVRLARNGKSSSNFSLFTAQGKFLPN
ncbi:MAG: tetratricopeptide repeat protein, partial [Alphaproteobacteria bacterium]|nr:tetratricopeptide repeat protein [Alphaproteobacteria bacterium]